MATETRPSLSTFIDWIRTNNSHAAHQLRLLAEAEPILDGRQHVAEDRRQALSVRLEQWRYQLLDEHIGRLTHRARQLADALDLAANQLAGRGPRLPRWPRGAVDDAISETAETAEARAGLSGDVDLERLARQATEVTLRHFGTSASIGGSQKRARRMLLYAPLYLSSHCVNHCAYCGFRSPLDIERKHLTCEEALDEAEILRGRGFRRILLVAGDMPRLTTTAYFAEIIRELVARGISPSIEIAPQSTASYAELVDAGACAITLYQETYNEELYALYHPRGSKASFDWRLEGLERAAEAGIGRLGLGVLLGLADPREDLLAMIRHACYLQARFPQRTLAFSLPRIYEAPPDFQTPYPVDDETFVRLYCVLRLAFPRAELVLSTREPARLRNRLAQICITQISAGSRTIPGGYGDPDAGRISGRQFPISDHRSPDEVAEWLRANGFELAWDVCPSVRRSAPRSAGC